MEVQLVSPEQVLDCLDDWLARNLMQEIVSQEQQALQVGGPLADSDCRYDFSHDLIRSVVYADLSQARRQIMHTQLGDALEQVYAGQLDQVVEWLAHHYHHGYRPGKALVYLQQAGQQAQTVYALVVVGWASLFAWEAVCASAVWTSSWRQEPTSS